MSIKVTWVDAEWLENNLDGNLTIIDTQPNIHDYIQEHVPGATYFNEGLLRASFKGRPGVYAPKESIELVLGRTGLDIEKTVLVYSSKGVFSGHGDGLAQTMVTYSLARYGVRELLVLDGGLDKWKVEGRALTKEFPHTIGSRFESDVQDNLFMTYNKFVETKDDDGVILLDARPEHLYVGQGPWIKPGHIPGAINLPWKGLMEPDNAMLLKDDQEILSALESKGIERDKKIICSCGTGREATNEFLLFKWYLKFPDVSIYEGSFTEWTSHPDNPTVTGASPR